MRLNATPRLLGEKRKCAPAPGTTGATFRLTRPALAGRFPTVPPRDAVSYGFADGFLGKPDTGAIPACGTTGIARVFQHVSCSVFGGRWMGPGGRTEPDCPFYCAKNRNRTLDPENTLRRKLPTVWGRVTPSLSVLVRLRGVFGKDCAPSPGGAIPGAFTRDLLVAPGLSFCFVWFAPRAAMACVFASSSCAMFAGYASKDLVLTSLDRVPLPLQIPFAALARRLRFVIAAFFLVGHGFVMGSTCLSWPSSDFFRLWVNGRAGPTFGSQSHEGCSSGPILRIFCFQLIAEIFQGEVLFPFCPCAVLLLEPSMGGCFFFSTALSASGALRMRDLRSRPCHS